MRRAVAAAVLALGCSFPIPFADAAQITDVSPTLAPTMGGATLTISGTGFSATDNLVLVGGRVCPVTFQNALVVECTLPALTGASQPIRVVDNGTGEASPPFPFGALPPTITAVSAASFPTAGGVTLTIDGANFGAVDGQIDVFLPSTPTPEICDDLHVEQAHTRVTCTLPPGEGTSVPVKITVAGQTSAPSSLSYDPPVITAVSPTRAPAAGGTVVTLTGTNFGPSTTVTVGGTSATCPAASISVSEVSIACVLPPSSGGPPVVVVTTGGQSSNAFPFSHEMIVSKCDAAKFNAAAGYAKCLLGAESKGDKKGAAADPAAVAKCDDKLTTSCAKAESKLDDCTQTPACSKLLSWGHDMKMSIIGNIR